MNEIKLRAKLLEHGLTVYSCAEKLGVNTSTLSKKLNGHSEFTRTEMIKLKEVLNLTGEEVEAIFFCD